MMDLQITFDAADITVGGQTISGTATVLVPVSPEQLLALLQGGGRMEVAPPVRQSLVVPKPPVLVPKWTETKPIAAAEPEPVVEPVPVAEPAQKPIKELEPAPVAVQVIDQPDVITIRKGNHGVFKDLSDDELRCAFANAGSVAAAASHFGVTPAAISYQCRRVFFVFPSSKVDKAEKQAEPQPKPVEVSTPPAAKVTERVYVTRDDQVDEGSMKKMTQRALDLGLFHLDDNGKVFRCPKGETPPPEVEEPVTPAPQPVVPSNFGYSGFPKRRPVLPVGTPEENQRLIDEATAAGRVTKLPPGRAINAHVKI